MTMEVQQGNVGLNARCRIGALAFRVQSGSKTRRWRPRSFRSFCVLNIDLHSVSNRYNDRVGTIP